MESIVKDCTTCQKHYGKKSIDDVHNDCYPCVHAEKTLGFYPHWEPVAYDYDRDDEWTAEAFYREAGPQFMTHDNENSLGELLRKRLQQPKSDSVNSPAHYTTGGIETIDYIKAKLGVQGTIAYCMGNVMKYTSRWQDKNGLEDLEKADWYLDYAINLMKEQNAHQ